MKLYYYLITVALAIAAIAAPADPNRPPPYDDPPAYPSPPPYHGPHQPPLHPLRDNLQQLEAPRPTHEAAAAAHERAMVAYDEATAAVNRVGDIKAQELRRLHAGHREDYDMHLAAAARNTAPSHLLCQNVERARQSERDARTEIGHMQTVIRNYQALAPQHNPHVQRLPEAPRADHGHAPEHPTHADVAGAHKKAMDAHQTLIAITATAVRLRAQNLQRLRDQHRIAYSEHRAAVLLPARAWAPHLIGQDMGRARQSEERARAATRQLEPIIRNHQADHGHARARRHEDAADAHRRAMEAHSLVVQHPLATALRHDSSYISREQHRQAHAMHMATARGEHSGHVHDIEADIRKAQQSEQHAKDVFREMENRRN